MVGRLNLASKGIVCRRFIVALGLEQDEFNSMSEAVELDTVSLLGMKKRLKKLIEFSKSEYFQKSTSFTFL